MAIALYYIIAALFPIDKIIGRFYPILAAMLIIGSLLVVVDYGYAVVSIETLDALTAAEQLVKDDKHIVRLIRIVVAGGEIYSARNKGAFVREVSLLSA